MIPPTSIPKALSKNLLACNIYVSAGHPSLSSHLLSLLLQSQKQCLSLLPHNRVAIVHAFTDVTYRRSSFHVAGDAEGVTTVSSRLASDAMTSLVGVGVDPLLPDENNNDVVTRNTRHPFVGIVDHVSVMPLERDGNDESEETTTAHGLAARAIGEVLSQRGCHVHYYGRACEDNTPLATVRRDKTSFFKSGGLETERGTSSPYDYGAATVGAPDSFVENFNVRLRGSDRRTAASLARALRYRDGGVVGVEALTLPYGGGGRYEVACNLLCPETGGGMDEVLSRLEAWKTGDGGSREDAIVEKAYRVGTTRKQCMDVLKLSRDGGGEVREEYDAGVLRRFEYGFVSDE
eukprot:CAMPEP_0172506510 /NCGR_PEP_ID=MMETSP1066-20121228/195708_1 /TAXON_ID=671091 /ORGANISM="Coscinodiscus wailesii, Strain CCMP2513" /LENGTH=347 /DNA_ID=CAMNT_0013283567 /DNA_START=53 /DNA_END=1096 /DNA_ORIENTATION=+